MAQIIILAGAKLKFGLEQAGHNVRICNSTDKVEIETQLKDKDDDFIVILDDLGRAIERIEIIPEKERGRIIVVSIFSLSSIKERGYKEKGVINFASSRGVVELVKTLLVQGKK